MLIDDLLYFHEADGRLKDALVAALRFQIDNVAAYAYDTMLSTEATGQPLDIADRIPNVAPLAPVMWFEFGGLAKGANKPATNRYGCLASIDYDRKDQNDVWYETRDARWVLCLQCFGRLSNTLVCMRWCHYISVLDDGRYGGLLAIASTNPSENEPQQLIAGVVYNEAITALLAICFAHCKGTAIEEHQPTRQVRRAAQRTGKPSFTFHTIDIHPSTTILKSEGHISENGLAHALHICRGHFAHYTEEHPLFGKYTGTFYRPMHVRGSASQGIAAKDYRIHPTKEAN